MKYIQTGFLKIIAFSVLLLPVLAHANERVLAQADSLFTARQYTQSFELYQALLKNGKQSPAMLLKMAYIQEGLGRIGQSLYYLNLYYLASDDEQVPEKMAELAQRFELTGYQIDEASQWSLLWKKNGSWIQLTLTVFALFFLILTLVQKIRRKRVLIPAVALLILLGLLLIQINTISHSRQLITNQSDTYLMSGPSAGADVIQIVKDGHRLTELGKMDVWIRTRWEGEEVFIRQNQALVIEL